MRHSVILWGNSCYRGEMHFRGEANNRRVGPIAIVGAALRFPGAADPASFHELTVAGSRMFRDIERVAAGRDTGDQEQTDETDVTGPPASHVLRAALLDADATPTGNQARAVREDGRALASGAAAGQGAAHEEAARHGAAPGTMHAGALPGRLAVLRAKRTARDGSHAGGVAAVRMLAAETAAAALADVPASGRPARRSRTLSIIASIPEPGAPDVTSWVRHRLGLAHPAFSRPGFSCSLRAIAAACDTLTNGQADLVLAGGVSVGISPALLSYRVQAGSPSGADVRVYDASPTGPLPGEGCGVVALMRAAEAREAGLPVYAEIAGWHAADDILQQATAMRHAYQQAGVDPADVQFIEGHGAATAADDLAELTALLEVLAPRDDRAHGGCALGSVTANIGDTSSAAGVAALLKTALAMTAGTIPPTTGCTRPHSLLRAEPTLFRLPAQPEPWPEAEVRVAAVNSLGAPQPARSARTGPVHIVLRRPQDPGRPAGRRRRTATALREAVPRGVPASRAMGAHAGPLIITPPPPRAPRESRGPALAQAGQLAEAAAARQPAAAKVIALQGADRADLAVTLDNIAVTAAGLSPAELGDFARELAGAPPAAEAPARAALVADDPGQLAERAGRAAAALRAAGPGLLRLWPHSAHRLPAHRQVTRPTGLRRDDIRHANGKPDRAGRQQAEPATAGPGVYLSEGANGRVVLLFPGLANTAVEHTAVLSASMATLAATDRLGVAPCAAVGYSLGEITGLAWAGVITFGEAARIASHRAEIIRATPGRGAMARVLAGLETAARLCAGTGLVIAAEEGPGCCVLAGPAADIRALPLRAANLGASVDVLSTTHALHSPAMRAGVAPMSAALADIRFAAPGRRLISSVTGLDITVSDDIAGLVAEHLARPTLLAGALALACADADLVLLASPDPELARSASACTRLPVAQAPVEHGSGPVPAALAAFFAAGAIRGVGALRGIEEAEAGGETRVRSESGEPSRSQAGALAARA